MHLRVKMNVVLLKKSVQKENVSKNPTAKNEGNRVQSSLPVFDLLWFVFLVMCDRYAQSNIAEFEYIQGYQWNGSCLVDMHRSKYLDIFLAKCGRFIL